jgi:hypothetical protein
MINLTPSSERRKHRRFIVSGGVRLLKGFDTGLGTLVNLGEGGILFRGRTVFPEGTKATFQISPARCPIRFEVEGEVVGVRDDLMAVRFLEERLEVSLCLQWLASENCPWTGTVTIEPRAAALAPSVPEQAVQEFETSRELVFQSA